MSYKHLNEAFYNRYAKPLKEDSDYIKIGNKTYPRDASKYGYEDPSKISRDTQNKIEADRKAKEEADRLNALKEQAKERMAKIESSKDGIDDIESWFAELVPPQGKCDTVAGEMVRAMKKILYRDYNDGDCFMFGYGLETCAAPASYLINNEYLQGTEVRDKLWKMVEDGEHYANLRFNNKSTEYTEAINEVSDALINFLKSHTELVATPNEEDMWNADADDIIENQPRFDWDIWIDNELDPYREEGYLRDDRIEDYVRDSFYCLSNYSRDHEVDVDSSEVYINKLTFDEYNEITREFDSYNRHGSFWDSLLQEMRDEHGYSEDWNTDEEEPEEDEEDLDESVTRYSKDQFKTNRGKINGFLDKNHGHGVIRDKDDYVVTDEDDFSDISKVVSYPRNKIVKESKETTKRRALQEALKRRHFV